MKYLIILTTLLLSMTTNAQQKFYEFAWQRHYGIVDTDGNEIVKPTYEWKQYILDYQSDFIALNTKNDGALIINTKTGKQEKLQYLTGSMLLEIDDHKWIHGITENKSWLIDNKNLDERKLLPNNYEKVWQREPYLICFTKYNGYQVTGIADIVDQHTLKVVKKDLQLINISSFFTEGMKPIFVVQQRDGALVFDKNFKRMGTLRKIEDSEDIAEMLETKFKIKIIELDKEEKVYEIAPRNYPFYDGKVNDGYMVYSLYTDRNTKTPLFKVKLNNYRFTSGEIGHPVEITTREPDSSRIFTIAHFYIEPTSYKLLFPKKYWQELGMELVSSSEND